MFDPNPNSACGDFLDVYFLRVDEDNDIVPFVCGTVSVLLQPLSFFVSFVLGLRPTLPT